MASEGSGGSTFKKNGFELVWKNKKTDTEKIALPFQTIETVNLSKGGRSTLKAFNNEKVSTNWKNKLIWSDNKYVLASLLKNTEVSGKVKLIYIDPPFFTGTNMKVNIKIGDNSEITKEPSAMEEIAYRNMWKDGPSSFFQYIYQRVNIMQELLAADGFIFVRFDYHYSHYIKSILDEIFGYNNFRNEIVLNRTKKNVMGSQSQRILPTATDSLFLYSKNEDTVLNKTTTPLEEKRAAFWRRMDDSAGQGSPKIFFGKELTPPVGKHFKYSQEKINEMCSSGEMRLKCKECGFVHTKGTWKRCPKCKKDNPRPEYLVEEKEHNMLDTNWTDIPGYSFSTGYPTENSEDVLQRVIDMCSIEGDLVADFFAGSGTTLAVAEHMNRRWIGCDIGRFSIHTIRKRLLDIATCKPFEVLNMGKYERQHWMSSSIGQDLKDYINFILELFHARPLSGMQFIHGKKGSNAVHVGLVDSSVTRQEITDALKECQKNNFDSLDILGWEYEMSTNDTIVDEAKKQFGVHLILRSIPREVMDRNVVETGDVEFYELAHLKINIDKEGEKVKVKLDDFFIPNPELIPEEIRKKIKSWSDYIDYWAVDWEYNDTFHNEWQSYRTKMNPKLLLEATYSKYPKGTHKIMVKVIDIFGNDTSKIENIVVK